MAVRTISNAGGNWSTTGAWVEGIVPTSADDVVATVTSGNLSHDVSTQACRSIDFTNYTGIFTFVSGQGPLLVGDASGGDVKLVPGMSIVHNAAGGGFKFLATTGAVQKFTTAGKSIGASIVNTGATTTVQLQDDVVSTQTTSPQLFVVNTGIFDSNGKTMTLPGLTAAASTTLTLGNSTINLSNTAANQTWAVTTSTTFTTNTATLNFTGNGPTVNPALTNYNGTTFLFSGGGNITMNGGVTATGMNVTVAPGASATSLKFTSTAWTITNLTMNGSAGTHHAILSTAGGTQVAMIINGTVSMSYVDFTDMIVTGTAAPLNDSVGGIDNGNNQGVKFSTPWVAQGKKLGTGSSATDVIVLPINTTAGNTIFVSAGSVSHPVQSITDNLGNQYHKIDSATGPPTEAWYAYNINAGACSITITVTASDTFVFGEAYEIGGVSTTDPLDKHVIASGNSTSASSGASGVTTNASEIVMGYVGSASGTQPTLGSGYKNLLFTSAANIAGSGEQKTVASTGAQTATFTVGSAAWNCGVATFLPFVASTTIQQMLTVGMIGTLGRH